MNVKWLERPCLMHFLQLFDSHTRNSTLNSKPGKQTRDVQHCLPNSTAFPTWNPEPGTLNSS
jgi:hypothetical protein